jgi:hypothetical protein
VKCSIILCIQLLRHLQGVESFNAIDFITGIKFLKALVVGSKIPVAINCSTIYVGMYICML